MTLQEYLRVLRKRGWIIVLAAVLAGMLAFAVSYLQQDLFRSTANVSTVPARADCGLGITAKDLLRNFAENLQHA